MGISEVKTERGLYVQGKLFKILISISTTYSKIIEIGEVAVLVNNFSIANLNITIPSCE